MNGTNTVTRYDDEPDSLTLTLLLRGWHTLVDNSREILTLLVMGSLFYWILFVL